MLAAPMRLTFALIAASLAAAPALASAQSEPIIEPLPGEPWAEPLTENGQPIDGPEIEARSGTEPALNDAVVSARIEIEPPAPANLAASGTTRIETAGWILSLSALAALLIVWAVAALRPRSASGDVSRSDVALAAQQSWQTAQAAFQPPHPVADRRSSDDLPTRWEPAQTGMGPDAYPQLRIGRKRLARGTGGPAYPASPASPLGVATPQLPLSPPAGDTPDVRRKP